jgi:hypothetical protein
VSITLDHTVVGSSDNEAAAKRFAGIMGLEPGERERVDGKFVAVRVNDTLRLFFVTSDKVVGQHLAFVVNDATFDGILGRLRQMAWHTETALAIRRTDAPIIRWRRADYSGPIRTDICSSS